MNWAPLARALSRMVVSPERLASVGVGPRTDEEAGGDEPADAVEIGDRVVDLEPGGRGMRLGDAREHQPPLERTVPFQVQVADLVLIVEREQDPPADRVEPRASPACG